MVCVSPSDSLNSACHVYMVSMKARDKSICLHRSVFAHLGGGSETYFITPV